MSSDCPHLPEHLTAGNTGLRRLAPLEFPPAGAALSADDALGFSAIRLFTERAMASLHTFELSDADVSTVADICHKQAAKSCSGLVPRPLPPPNSEGVVSVGQLDPLE